MALTVRQYFDDAYQTTFRSQVVKTVPMRDRTGIILDETYFYPTSGGQPFDKGRLAGFEVVDVTDEPEGIIHWIPQVVALDGKIEGQIDWPRRFDHMQQHTGQHILSAAFLHTLGKRAETLSFHLGDESCTIDITRRVITEDEIRAVEQMANKVLWEDRAVEVLYPSQEQLKKISLRKDPAVTEQVRIVSIENFDFSPCGGTHVLRTGEIGLIKIIKCEKSKGELTRVEFVCGIRALKTFQYQNSILHSLANFYSSGIDTILSNTEKTKLENHSLRKDNKTLMERLRSYQQHEMIQQAERIQDVHLVFKVFEEGDRAYLRSLSSAIAEKPGFLSIFLINSDDLPIIISAAADIRVRANELLQELISHFGGKGGGNSTLAQGGLTRLNSEEIVDNIKKYIRSGSGTVS